MKVLNFTAVEILPALLSKAKTQTIRPIKLYSGLQMAKDMNKYTNQEKPARFKVGDKVRLMWNQRSKYKKFCSICGQPKPIEENTIADIFLNQHGYCDLCIDTNNLLFKKQKQITFNKLLGIGTITQVFKIEMMKKDKKLFVNGIKMPHLMIAGKYWFNVFAKLDGFSSVEQMFSYFDKHYDLSKPKQFHVYRWSWDK